MEPKGIMTSCLRWKQSSPFSVGFLKCTSLMPSELSGLVRLKHLWVLTPDLLFHSLTGMRGKDEARQVRNSPVVFSCGCQSVRWECLPLMASVVETSEALLTRAFQFGPGAHKWDDVLTPSISNGICASWYQTLWLLWTWWSPSSWLQETSWWACHLSASLRNLKHCSSCSIFFMVDQTAFFSSIYTHRWGQSSSGYKFVQWASVKWEPHR